MVSVTKRSRWGYDPNWIRVEHLDAGGNPLGFTEFERDKNGQSSGQMPSDNRRAGPRRRRHATLALIGMPTFLLGLLSRLIAAVSWTFWRGTPGLGAR